MKFLNFFSQQKSRVARALSISSPTNSSTSSPSSSSVNSSNSPSTNPDTNLTANLSISSSLATPHDISSYSQAVSHQPARSRRGDTIIEVTISITIFTIIATIAMGLMDRNLAAIQGSLELSMARNEIDAQAEALRFIHNSFISDKELVGESQAYKKLWQAITQNLINIPSTIPDFSSTTCEAFYEGEKSIYNNKAFIINTRNIKPDDPASTLITTNDISSAGIRSRRGDFTKSPLYPRVIFTDRAADSSEVLQESNNNQDAPTFNQVGKVEGFWIIATRDITSFTNGATITDEILKRTPPEFYDFHIRTCWNAPGKNVATTIDTIIRLYNPEYIEVAQ